MLHVHLKPHRPGKSAPNSGAFLSTFTTTFQVQAQDIPCLVPLKPSVWSLTAWTPSMASLAWKDELYHVTPQLKMRQHLYIVMEDKSRTLAQLKALYELTLPLLDHLGPFTVSLHRRVPGPKRANTKSTLFNILNSEPNRAWCTVVIQQVFSELIQMNVHSYQLYNFSQVVWQFLASISFPIRWENLLLLRVLLGGSRENLCKAQ